MLEALLTPTFHAPPAAFFAARPATNVDPCANERVVVKPLWPGTAAIGQGGLTPATYSFGSMLIGLNGVKTANDQLNHAISALRRLRTMSRYAANWDGEGASAPRLELFDAAQNLIGFLGLERLRIHATLDSDGRPVILLTRGDDEGEITITSPNRLDFSWLSEAGDLGEADVPFGGQQLPDVIMRALAPMMQVAA